MDTLGVRRDAFHRAAGAPALLVRAARRGGLAPEAIAPAGELVGEVRTLGVEEQLAAWERTTCKETSARQLERDAGTKIGKTRTAFCWRANE